MNLMRAGKNYLPPPQLTMTVEINRMVTVGVLSVEDQFK